MFDHRIPVESIQADLLLYGPKIEAAYAEILGPELFNVLQEADRQYLSDASFINDQTGVGRSNPPAQNVFGLQIAGRMSCDCSGSFKVTGLMSSPYFIFSQESIDAFADLYRPVSVTLGPLIQGYSFFVLWAIQPDPVSNALALIDKLVNPNKTPVNVTGCEVLAERTRLALRETYQMLDEMMSDNLRFLNEEVYRLVFGKTLFESPLARKPEFEFVGFCPDEVLAQDPFWVRAEAALKEMMDQLQNPEDFFAGIPLRERIKFLLVWQEYLTPISVEASLFMNSFVQTNFERISLEKFNLLPSGS